MEDVAAGKFGNSVYLAVEILRRDDPRHVAAIRIMKALILDTGRQVVRLRCGAAHVENPGNRMHAERPIGQGIGLDEGLRLLDLSAAGDVNVCRALASTGLDRKSLV